MARTMAAACSLSSWRAASVWLRPHRRSRSDASSASASNAATPCQNRTGARSSSVCGRRAGAGARGRPGLHLGGEFHRVAIPLAGIGGDRPLQNRPQPGGQVGAQRGQVLRPVAPGRAYRVRIAVRVFAGEGAEHGHAQRIDVGRLVAGFAVEHFRRHIGRRAGNVLAAGSPPIRARARRQDRRASATRRLRE